MEGRANVLRAMKICRFCLSEEGPLTNIYERLKDSKQTVPLPLQLMACVAIEVFANDGMPQQICKTCRAQTLMAYTFKTNCKKADDALKVFLATGSLVKPWTTPEIIEQRQHAQAFKRTFIQPEEPAPKRGKKDNTEVITLNYSTNMTQSHSKEPSGNNSGSREIKKADEDHYTQHVVEEDDEEELGEEEEEEEEEDDVKENSRGEGSQQYLEGGMLNPALKVNQVKTDCYPCPHCERSFPLKQLLELHMENHARERRFTCDECDKAFFTKYDLSKHLLTHTGSKPYTCVVCEKTFARESLLHRHEKIHVDVPKYLCTQCDKTFLTGEDLDAHAAKHKKKRPFACRVCQKSFVFKQGLERHELSHTNIKPHKCNYCEASFTSAIKLTRHVTSHAGLRPYPCKICGRTFLLSHHLTRHMKSHYAAQQPEAYMPPVGQHKCDICSMSFRRKDSLINHSAIHSMVNLKCVICNTEFDNVMKVKEHITTHLSDLPFPCEKCDYSFESQEQLEDHEMKHAEMEYEDQIEQEVIAEARQALGSGGDGDRGSGNEDDMSDEYSDDVAEFTITNDMNNPELVRRSKRPTKIKNYAQFLKDELGSDLEDSVEEEAAQRHPQQHQQQHHQQQQHQQQPHHQQHQQPHHQQLQKHHKQVEPEEVEYEQDEVVVVPTTSAAGAPEEESIKPIVRSEGTKVYTRKNLPERRSIPQLNVEQLNAAAMARMSQQPSMSTLDHIASPKDINKLPDKEIFNMKIGDKTVTVQKLLLTKEQMRAMAREGKIEKKGNTLLLKKSPGQSFTTLNFDAFQSAPKLTTVRQQIKKTYPRKVASSEAGGGALNESINLSNIEFEGAEHVTLDDSMSHV